MSQYIWYSHYINKKKISFALIKDWKEVHQNVEWLFIDDRAKKYLFLMFFSTFHLFKTQHSLRLHISLHTFSR